MTEAMGIIPSGTNEYSTMKSPLRGKQNSISSWGRSHGLSDFRNFVTKLRVVDAGSCAYRSDERVPESVVNGVFRDLSSLCAQWPFFREISHVVESHMYPLVRGESYVREHGGGVDLEYFTPDNVVEYQQRSAHTSGIENIAFQSQSHRPRLAFTHKMLLHSREGKRKTCHCIHTSVSLLTSNLQKMARTYEECQISTVCIQRTYPPTETLRSSYRPVYFLGTSVW
ncbi:uncharacterized protein K489DRAFT_188528 [Dissoconium aciculare CBS 342.82]|uniref:Uncharacterized protein n=1 Tax=Dissoconium aciculare CBS 342.82 TaxID=1314786 RepID=A0A6J3M9K3_9PEZI|nr:uncharacterized protein K489DRAFT_188528 [Dissoconium aciculare CBS 342.82]KAF1824731.1 hypothetical protein K489DRAFT_188528 [Dissoconium aciculare CBS 342.82]